MTALIMKETYLALTTACTVKHTDTNTQRADRHEPPLTQIFTELPSNQYTRGRKYNTPWAKLNKVAKTIVTYRMLYIENVLVLNDKFTA